VARILHDHPDPKTLVFNYSTRFNDIWSDAGLMAEHNYDVRYGDGEDAVRVELL
jgi:hypothetical protein